jgi:hypothetical protein
MNNRDVKNDRRYRYGAEAHDPFDVHCDEVRQ